MGYDLDRSKTSNLTWRFFKLFYCAVFLSANLVRFLTMVENFTLIISKNSTIYLSPSTVTEMWYWSFFYLNEGFQAFGIHASMFLVVIFKWKHLWECLQKTDQVLVFRKSFYRQLRKVGYFLSWYLLTVKYEIAFEISAICHDFVYYSGIMRHRWRLLSIRPHVEVDNLSGCTEPVNYDDQYEYLLHHVLLLLLGLYELDDATSSH